jgi:hypothetical protein
MRIGFTHPTGAASQLARKLGVELVDLTCDGNTTHGVLADLARAPAADVVTLTAGGNDVGRRELGLSRMATIALRRRLNAVNGGIARLAGEHGFLVADLEQLFHGHGVVSNEPWFVQVIEPNLAGASAIAEHWYELLTSQ